MTEIKEKSKKKGWVKILLLIIPFFIITGLFEFLGSLLAGVDMMDVTAVRTTEQNVIIRLMSLAGSLLLLWIFMKFVDQEKFVELGFQTKSRFKEFLVGIGLGFIVMGFGFSILLALKEISVESVRVNWTEILLTFIIFICVSIVEETLTRGYILKNLMQSMNRYVALIVSSAIFSAMHLLNPNIDLFSILVLFLAGILLGMSYIYTKNLWFPIGLHLSWNFFQSIFGFKVSGLDIYTPIVTKYQEANLLNGGEFGFEGSILCVCAQVVLIGGIALFYFRKENAVE